MKNLMNMTLAMMAISTSAGASAAKANTNGNGPKGRIIEFKSDANGFDTRTFFYEGEKEVVAFDAQFTPELARQSIAHLRTYTNKPISWLVISHPNPDKFNGASVFKEAGAKILASTRTAAAIPEVHAYKEYFFVEIAKMFRRGQYPQPVSVDHVFSGQMDLVLQGGERIELRELSQPGVSSTQTVAYIKSAKALFVGDLIHYKAHAWLEGGIVEGKPIPRIDGWIADLNEVATLYSNETQVFGGRGRSSELGIAVESQVRYLRAAVQLIDDQLRVSGISANDLNGPNAGAFYRALAEKFQRAFPDYELPYMIEYGAYGLVQSEFQHLN